MPIAKPVVRKCAVCGKSVVVMQGDNLGPSDIISMLRFVCDECKGKGKV